MAIKPVPSMTEVPPFPALSDRAAGDYNSKAFLFGSHMAEKFNEEVTAVAANVMQNAFETEAKANSAQVYSQAAAASLEAAAAIAGASLWVPGSFVKEGKSAISLVDAHTYRKLKDGASLADPSEDPDNWFDLTSANKRDAEIAVSAANLARAGAEAARDAANSVGKIFTTTAAGIAGTTNGQSFCLLSGDATQLILYRNNSGTATEVTRYYTKAYMDSVLDSSVGAAVPSMAFVDEDNHAFFVALDDGSFGTKDVFMGRGEIRTADFSIEADTAGSFSLVDEEGFVGFRVDNDGLRDDSGGASDARADLAERNMRNLAYSAMVRSEFNSEVQRPVCKYNHILTTGQSLSTGMEGWPALSKVAKGGSLMFGDSVRPSSVGGAGFTPLGVAALKPLKAVVQSTSGSSILTDAQVAALAPGAGNEGESSDIGAVNYARKLFLQTYGFAADPGRLFVASNCGVSGKTIESLSKGAAPELYQRVTQAAQGVKAIADAEGATYCVPAVLFMQGEYNYTTAYGGAADKATYKARLRQYRADVVADVCAGIAGQAAPPAFITYQTGATYTSDANDLAIGQAQLELGLEERNWYLATPAYPYTDKGGHLDANGYRWLGMQMGKVLHRVVTLGQSWKPLSPRAVTVNGGSVLIDFHVPHPPLVFDAPYVALAAASYPTKGFKVLDEVGVVPIQAVEIAADTVVRIVLGRAPVGAVRVQYADKALHNGNGNLRDSDPAVASENYEYIQGTGHYAGANIAALVDRPYPLHNWCVAFSMTATAI